MAYRNGTYVAFDGLGEADPTKSDFKYYGIIQSWDASKEIDFQFVNSHDKTYAVKDTSLLETLKNRINERLSNSKNAIIILSPDTRKNGSLLTFEIEQAVDYYKIPLVISYVDVSFPVRVVDLFQNYWPYALSNRIKNNTAKAIHVPFKKEPIFDAIGRFGVNGKMLGDAKVTYNDEAYKAWRII